MINENKNKLQVKDTVPSLYSSYDGEYAFNLVQDAVANNKSKARNRREKGRPGIYPVCFFGNSACFGESKGSSLTCSHFIVEFNTV